MTFEPPDPAPGVPGGPLAPEPQRGSRPRPRRRLDLLVAVVAAVVVTDQMTKSLALSRLQDGPVHLFWTLRLNLSFNSGVAFSQGRGLTPFITAAVVVLVAGLALLSRKVRGVPATLAVGLLLGGACGNLADRVLRGHGGAVVDFIDLQWWPVFNVADVAITAGALLLVLTGLRDEVVAA